MTAVTSPKDLIAAYRLAARQNALLKASPTDRSVFPGLSLEPTGMIYLRGKKAMYKPIDAVTASAVDPDILVELLTAKDKSTVVADAETFSKLLVMADNLPSSDNKSLARRLRIAESLPGSVKMPVLTRALAYRYWLPEGLDDHDFEQWAESFNITSPTTAIKMRSLMSVARLSSAQPHLRFKETASKLEDLERRLHETAAFGGRANDNYIYDMLDQYTAISAGLRSVDPGLLEMHVLDGTVCRITPQNNDYGSLTATVSNPFKLKEGAKVRLTDGTGVAECTLRKLRFASKQLYAEFTQPSSKSGGSLMITRAKNGTAPLYVAESVYASFGTAPKNKRWTNGAVEPVAGRKVPMDVIIAGAPVSDS